MTPLYALLMLSPLAHANGQTTHIWISRRARELLPAGELSDLMQAPAYEPMWVHGTMFPDGGYAVGHPFGEAAHWEPFQAKYLEWIKTEFATPYGPEAAPHIAFLMGLGSHGLADQTFDANYQDRSIRYDGDLGWAAGRSMDEATDFKWASLTGSQDVPERWVPKEVLVALYAEYGIDVDEATLDAAQDLLELVVSTVGLSADLNGDLTSWEDNFPWAMSNLQNPDVPGIPEYEAEVVAGYWTELWGRLHDLNGRQFIDRTWPPDGGYNLQVDPDSPDARISVVFRQGMLRDDLGPAAFSVLDEDGVSLSFDTWLFYGDHSHILHIVPTEPWPENAWLTVTVNGGLTAAAGAVLTEPYSFQVATFPAPADSGDTAIPDDSEPNEDDEAALKTRCGCANAPAHREAWLLALLPLLWIRREARAPVKLGQAQPRK